MMLRRCIAAGMALAISVTAGSARAESASAAAEALFNEGKRLFAEGKAVEACRKFEDSNRIEPGLGTRFNLAQCLERTGRTASAYTAYLDIATDAHARGQAPRAKLARDRAAAIEHKLIRMTLDVRGSDVQGLTIKRDGVTIERLQWGAALPIDAGGHTLEAFANGHNGWKAFMEITPDKTAWTVVIPELEAKPLVRSASPDGVLPRPESGTDGIGSGRTVALLIGGVGVVGLGVGTFFGLRAMSKKDEAVEHCRGEACDPRGVTLRSEAVKSGDMSSLSFAAGGGLLLLGTTLWFLLPGARPQRPRDAAQVGRIEIKPGPFRIDFAATF
jgi:hypothetical protein